MDRSVNLATRAAPLYELRVPLASLVRPRIPSSSSPSPLIFGNLDKIIAGNFIVGRTGDVKCSDLVGATNIPRDLSQHSSPISKRQLNFVFDDQSGNFGVFNESLNQDCFFQANPNAQKELIPKKVIDQEASCQLLKTNNSNSVILPGSRFVIDAGEDPAGQRMLRFMDLKKKGTSFNFGEAPVLDKATRDPGTDLFLNVCSVSDQSRVVTEPEIVKSLPTIDNPNPFASSEPFEYVGSATEQKFKYKEPQWDASNKITLAIGNARNTDNNFTTDNSSVSGSHLSLTIDRANQEVIAFDRGSSYGTYVWHHLNTRPSLAEFHPVRVGGADQSSALSLNKGWTISLAGVIFIRNDVHTGTITISEQGKTPVAINTRRA